jgi:hypothetical protein
MQFTEVAILLTEVVTPPTEVVTPPTEVVTPPTEVVTPPTEVVTPPTEVVIPHTEVVIPPTEVVIPPTEVVIPPTEVATPSIEVVTLPIEILTLHTEVVTPPIEVMTPPIEVGSLEAVQCPHRVTRAVPLRAGGRYRLTPSLLEEVTRPQLTGLTDMILSDRTTTVPITPLTGTLITVSTLTNTSLLHIRTHTLRTTWTTEQRSRLKFPHVQWTLQLMCQQSPLTSSPPVDLLLSLRVHQPHLVSLLVLTGQEAARAPYPRPLSNAHTSSLQETPFHQVPCLPVATHTVEARGRDLRRSSLLGARSLAVQTVRAVERSHQGHM